MCDIARAAQRTRKAHEVLVRSLKKTEQANDAKHKEYLAVMWAVRLLRLYFEGSGLTIQIDQDGLKWILNMTDATANLARWRLKLSEVDFEVVHWDGLIQQAAHALSCLETAGMHEYLIEDNVPVFTITEVQQEE